MSKELTEAELEEIAKELDIPKARQIKGGAIVNSETGIIVRRPPGQVQHFTKPGEAAKAANTKWDKYRQEGEKGLDRAGGGKGVEQSWGDIVESQANMAKSGKRESTAAAAFIAKSLNIIEPQNAITEALSGHGENANMIALLVASLKPHMYDDDDIVDVEPVESE